MALIVFEDELWRHFAPIAQARPVFELRCGGYTARERATAVAAQAGANVGPALGMARAHLMPTYGPATGLASFLQSGDPVLLVNGRCLELGWLPKLLAEPINTIYLAEDDLVGAWLSPALASTVLYYLREQQAADARDELRRFATIVELPAANLPARVRYPWDLISQSGEQLVRDLPLLAARLPLMRNGDGQIVRRGEQIYVDPSARLDGPLVLDSRDGPIYIEAGAQIEPFSFIQGPAYIGPGSLIASARIRGETSIGPVCRIGGEVEACIVQGFSNKHHDGFFGHSWLGEWVNIGAMTTNSDLKNTYGSVRVVLDGIGQLDSGVLKLGCFLADHVKLGIGLHLNGGTIIGTGSNIFGVHSAPKTVPPFTWGGEVFREYRIDNMISVARTVMGRRKRELSPQYENLLREVFRLSRASRGDMAITPAAARGPSEQTLARAEADALRGFEQAVGVYPG